MGKPVHLQDARKAQPKPKFITARQALEDALRVVDDLAADRGQLVIPVDELEFGLRLLRRRLEGCLDAVAVAARPDPGQGRSS